MPAPAAATPPAKTALDAPVAGDFEEEFFFALVVFSLLSLLAFVVASSKSTTAFTTTEPLFQAVIAFREIKLIVSLPSLLTVIV